MFGYPTKTDSTPQSRPSGSGGSPRKIRGKIPEEVDPNCKVFKIGGPQMGGQIRCGWIWRFWGAPIICPEVPKPFQNRYLGTSGLTIGAPQKRRILPRRIWPPRLRPSDKSLGVPGTMEGKRVQEPWVDTVPWPCPRLLFRVLNGQLQPSRAVFELGLSQLWR